MAAVADDPVKADLHHYLRRAREALLWKLEGLGERDLRRPLTPTGTNLLGLVKHLTGVEAGYFGACLGRGMVDVPWDVEGLEDNADMWATAEESSEEVVDLYRRVTAAADENIEALPMDAPARVPWWGEHGDVSLGRLLVHMVAETARHGGHADIVRELVDSSVGLREGVSNLPEQDEAWWAAYRARLQAVADGFSGPERSHAPGAGARSAEQPRQHEQHRRGPRDVGEDGAEDAAAGPRAAGRRRRRARARRRRAWGCRWPAWPRRRPGSR